MEVETTKDFHRRFGKQAWWRYAIARLFAWVFGWKVVGELPPDPKCIGILAPHTSNWDVLYMYLMADTFRIKANWLAKDSLLRPPFGWFFRPLGALPVERKHHNNVVEQVAHLFAQQDEMYLAVAPEGTRYYTERWKTGFYLMALEADVPIICMKIDYKKKETGFGPMIRPTGDIDKDCEPIWEFFREVTPRNESGRSKMTFDLTDERKAEIRRMAEALKARRAASE